MRQRLGLKSICNMALFLILSIVMLVSSLINRTFAWNELQYKINEFIGTSSQCQIQLIKYEKDVDGNNTTIVVNGAEFYLYKETDDGNNKIGGKYLTDLDGKIQLDGLTFGDYYFIETTPPYGFTYDIDDDGNDIMEYHFTVSDELQDETINITVYNRRLYADLTIKKSVVNDIPLTEEQETEEFPFKITLTDKGIESINTYKYSIYNADSSVLTVNEDIKSGDILKMTHGQKAAIHNLPVGIEYTVTELPVAGYIISSSNNQSNIPVGGITAEFINTAWTANGKLSINKTVINADGTDLGGWQEDDEFEFTVTFSAPGDYTYNIDNVQNTVASGGKIKIKHNQTAEFVNLPVGITYTVTEESSEDYIASIKEYSGMIPNGEVVLPFINVNDTDITTSAGSLTVSKKVKGDILNENKEFEFEITFTGTDVVDVPDEIKYTLGNGDEKILSDDGKIILTHDQTALFSDLPVGLNYTVIESDYTADGYTATIDKVSGTITSINVTTAFVNIGSSEINTELIIKKKVEGEIPSSDIGKKFAFVLTINDVKYEFELEDEEEKRFSLPVGFVYDVYEKDYIDEGYVQTSITNGYGTATGEVIEIIKTNTFLGTVYIKIDGEKTWNVPADKVSLKPSSILVYLKNGNAIVDSKVVKPDKDGNWLYTFSAPKYDKNSEIITYTVEEEYVDDFESTVTGYDIRNTYIAPGTYKPSSPISPATYKLTVQKIIKGDTPKTKSDFSFILESQNKAPMPGGTSGITNTVIISGTGEREFGSIKFTKAGTYTYTVRETKGSVKGYVYDNSIYALKVIVERQGNKLKVSSAVFTKLDDMNNYSKAVFTNTYNETEVIPDETEVTSNETEVTSDETEVTSNETEVISNAIKVTSNETEVVSNETEIESNETKVTSNKTVGQSELDNTSERPKTGDESNTVLWISLLSVSAVLLVILLIAERKRK